MLNGENSVFTPKDGSNPPSNDDGFTGLTIPDDGTVVLKSKTAVELTKFTLRVNEVCSNGGTLLLNVVYFGENDKFSTVSVKCATLLSHLSYCFFHY